jgi:hypothetical protein
VTPEQKLVKELAEDVRVVASNYFLKFAFKKYDSCMKKFDKINRLRSDDEARGTTDRS